MGYGDHNVPSPLRDEDRWYKLTKRQWAILLPAALVALGIGFLMYKIHLLPVGIAIGVLLVVGAGFVAFMELPDDKFMYGTGVKLEILLFRIIYRKLPGNKKIYTKNLDNGIERWKKKS